MITRRRRLTRAVLAAEAAEVRNIERTAAEKRHSDLTAMLRSKTTQAKALRKGLARLTTLAKIEHDALLEIARGLEDEVYYYTCRVDEARERVRKLGGKPLTLGCTDDVMTLLEGLAISNYSLNNATPAHVMLYVTDERVEEVRSVIKSCKAPAVSIDVHPMSTSA